MGASSGAPRRTTMGRPGGFARKTATSRDVPALARDPAQDRDAVQPQALGGRRVAGHEGVEVLVREVEDGPDVQDHPVAVEALAGRPARLDAADGAQRLEEHALELGQLDHVPRRAAHRGEVADLGHDEEPLVARVALGHRAEEVHVVHGGQALDVEVPQPLQLQALRHHGVHVPEGGLLRVAPRGHRAEGEVLHAARPGHRDHDPPERARQGGPGQQRARLRGVRLGVARALRPPEEDVAHELPLRRGGGGEPPHAGERRDEARLGGVGEEGVAERARRARSSRPRRGGRRRSPRGSRRGPGSGRSVAAALRGWLPAPASRRCRTVPRAARRGAAGTGRAPRRERRARPVPDPWRGLRGRARRRRTPRRAPAPGEASRRAGSAPRARGR